MDASVIQIMLSRHSGAAEIYIANEPTPWQVSSVDELFDDGQYMFIGATLESDGSKLYINTMAVHTIVFTAPEGDDGEKDPIPEETKKPTKAVSKLRIAV